MKKLLFIWSLVALGFVALARADGLQWNIPGGIGTVQLPISPTDILPVIGYDAVQKEVIAGGAASLITLFKEVDGYVGAVGNLNTAGPFVQPYLGAGSDFARYVPVLRQIQNLEVQAFVRYVPSGNNSKNYGAGGAIAYRFGPAKPAVPQAPSQPTGAPIAVPDMS